MATTPLLRRAFALILRLTALLLLAGSITGCVSTGTLKGTRPTVDRLQMYRAIPHEPPGDYWIGRRFYKEQLGFWGYIRRPGQPWHEAQLIMMNENDKFMYDREQGKIGIDDNFEYKLYGNITGVRIYEPATNSWYDELRLTGYEIRDMNPPSIFGNNFKNLKTQNVISKPEVIKLSDWVDPPTEYYTPPAYMPATPAYVPPTMPTAPVISPAPAAEGTL